MSTSVGVREHGAAVLRRYGMRAGPVIATVLLLAACAGAPLTTGSPAPDASATPSPGGASPTAAVGGWRELASGLWLPERPFAVAAATGQAELDQLWTALGQQHPSPGVDFEQEIVLFMGMSGSSSCPERLERLLVDHTASAVRGIWDAAEPGQACTDDLQAQGLLLAVERSSLPKEPFLLSLRDRPVCPGCAEQPDQLVVDPAG